MKTYVNESYSNISTVSCIVSQGCILCPKLFLIYIDDLPSAANKLDSILYSDDTNLFFELGNIGTNRELINIDLKNGDLLVDWLLVVVKPRTRFWVENQLDLNNNYIYD